MAHHYEGDDLIVRKIEVGTMENNTYVLECPETHKALLVDGCFEPDKILEATEGADVVAIIQTHGHGDHVQALPDLVEKLDVPVIAHPGDDYPVPVKRELSDNDEIEFGKRKVPRHPHSGTHTRGHLLSHGRPLDLRRHPLSRRSGQHVG